MVVGRRARRLQHEDILAADVLQQLDHDLAVAELRDRGLAELDVQVPRHLLRELRVGVAREHHQVVEGHRSLYWQGRKDSNPRMPESKSGALTSLATPLHSPIRARDGARALARRNRSAAPAR